MTKYSPDISSEDWQSARKIWSAAGEEIPETPDKNSEHYFTDLKRVVVNFDAAKTNTERDRERELSFSGLANQCLAMCQTLSELDDVSRARLAGATPIPVDQVLEEAISSLSVLEFAARISRSPQLPRKKKHEHNNYLVVLLAALNDDGARAEAVQIIRTLVDEIRLHPVDGQLQIELVGDLANLIGFAEAPENKNPGFTRNPGRTKWLVAGARNNLYRTVLILPRRSAKR